MANGNLEIYLVQPKNLVINWEPLLLMGKKAKQTSEPLHPVAKFNITISTPGMMQLRLLSVIYGFNCSKNISLEFYKAFRFVF